MKLNLHLLGKRESGQGFVEFALILPLLLFVSVGVIEGGYLLFSYSSVLAASREAARYAAATGETPTGQPCYYLDKDGIIAAGERMISLVDIEITENDITYDSGPGTAEFDLTSSAPCSSLDLGDRVNVNVQADYEPILVGLTPLHGFTISSRTSRTILKEITIYGNPGGGGGGGGSPPFLVSITSPSPNTYFDEGTSVNFTAAASGGTSPYHSWSWTSSRDGVIGSSNAFSTNSLSIGNHVITVQVNDSSSPNKVATHQIVINIRGKPVVTILQPADGAHYQFGTPIQFNATAIDPEDGDITDQIVWKKSDGTVMGNGGTVTITGWAVGPHTVSAEVTDTSLFFSSTTVSFVVDPELPPVVTIITPSNGSTFQPNTGITFRGTAIDQIDGDLTSQMHWFDNGSQIPGGVGGSFTAVLSPGTHLIEARAEDSPPEPNLGTASITIVVSSSNPPTVNILEPTTGPTYTVLWNETIKFRAEAWAWDGSGYNPAQSSVVWIDTSPDPDIIIGTGTVTKSNLSAGTHIILAQVTDANGVKGSDTITIIVQPDPTPVVTITSPTVSQSYFGESVRFTGLATDVPQGNLSSSLIWTSSLMQGSIGAGATFTTTALIAGTHVITASVTDSSGNRGFATKSFTVKQLVCPTPDGLVVETTGSAPIKAKYSWGMTMPSGGGGTGILERAYISWVGGTLTGISWEGGPTTLYNVTTSTSPVTANQNIPLEYTWAGKLNVVFLFSNEPQNNKLIRFEVRYRGCPTYTITYLN